MSSDEYEQMVETEPTAERKIRQQEALILSQLIKAKRGCIIWQKCAEQLLEYLLWVLSRRDAWSLRQYTNTTRLEPEANPTRTRRLTSDYSSKQTLTSDYSSNPRADYNNEPVTPPPHARSLASVIRVQDRSVKKCHARSNACIPCFRGKSYVFFFIFKAIISCD